MTILRRIRRLRLPAVVIAATFTTFASTRVEAQAPVGSGTAASQLRLIADQAQPAATAPAAASYPARQSTSSAPGNPPAVGGAAGSSVPLPSRRGVDPTVPDAAIRPYIEESRNDASAPSQAFPDIRLRARIIAEGRPPTALIEIGGPAMRAPATPMPEAAGMSGQRRQAYRPTAPQPTGVFRTIREGDEFLLPIGDSSPIRVLRVTKEEVVIEIVNRKTQFRLD
jgi:hypothetical protein